MVGAGGMGEVYKARDTRLDRIVAVKVSREEFSERFEREARSIAQLNHPNICTLFDVGPNFLVMEFVEGETLGGPLPIPACVSYARQIAEAIEAAHDKGIIHRDLKPANIKVTPEGSIKVLDFGLAKAFDTEVASAPGPDSPTLSMTMTRAGMILGTAAYMAPEQAKGKQADRRADIWAFGVVLFEMLTGKQAFTGETAAETLASVMMAPLSLERLPDSTPPALRQVVSRCLERDVRRRLQAIGEARLVLEAPLDAEPQRVPSHSSARLGRWIPWSLVAMLFVALTALAYVYFKPSTPAPLTRFPITLDESQRFSIGANRLLVTLSPDGSQIIYAANNRLYLRSMADLQTRLIAGTEMGNGVAAIPAFSPDGNSVAFYWSVDQTIKRAAVSGGAAVTVCPTGGGPFGISWTPDGIVFGLGKDIFRVSENGGKPEALITVKDGERVTQPQLLPGGKAVLFTVGPDNGLNSDWDKAQVVVQPIHSGNRKVLVEGGSDGRYLSTGHLIYALGGALYARRFDSGGLSVSGSPVSIIEGVSRGGTGVANFSVSDNGSLAYIPGPTAGGFASAPLVLALVDRNGNVEALKAPVATYGFPRVSQDGKHVAYDLQDGKDTNIGVYDISGTNAPRPITFGGVNRYPVWAPHDRVAFQSEREGDAGIWWTRADGTGTAERLTKPEKGAIHTPDSWSPDGENFLFSMRAGTNNLNSLWLFSLKDRKATLFAEGTASNGVFSPNGHWVAYQAFESGETRMYVQPFPPTGAKYRVPQDGNNHHAVWSPDGTELFFVPGNTQLASVSFTTRPSPAFGPPMPMPKGSVFNTREPQAVRNYDILPDGKHFIGVIPPDRMQSGDAPRSAQQIQIVLNWIEELQRRVPAR
jgi:serine/threonine-protein kinase